jgi:hypothetical protein
MMGRAVKQKIKAVDISWEAVGEKLQIRPQPFNQRLTTMDKKVSTLVEIARAADLSLYYFLEDYADSPTNSLNPIVTHKQHMATLGLLRQLLKDKDQAIAAYRKVIQTYKLLLDERKRDKI